MKRPLLTLLALSLLSAPASAQDAGYVYDGSGGVLDCLYHVVNHPTTGRCIWTGSQYDFYHQATIPEWVVEVR